MAEKKDQEPIIVKRVKKVVGGHGGGVWKIAYADFVTAMMAFFLLMWVLGSTTTGDLAGISAYFQNPLRLTLEGGQGSGDQNSIIKGGGPQIFRTQGVESKADADTAQRRISDSRIEEDERLRLNVQAMQDAKTQIQTQMQSDPELAKTKNQVFMDISAEGLRIQIVDEKNRAMFSVGGAEMATYAVNLLRLMGSVLKDMPNMVRIEGHTDGLKYGNGPAGYSNWELSTERANAARREMVRGGLQEERVSQVVGFADTIRLNPSNPNDPLNRRISITVQKQTLGSLPSSKSAPPSPPPKALEKGAAPAKAAPTKSATTPPTVSSTPAGAAAPAAAPTPAGAGQPAPVDQSGRTPVLVLPPRPQISPNTVASPPAKK